MGEYGTIEHPELIANGMLEGLKVTHTSSNAKMESQKTSNALLSDICIGTSAAPTYFPAHHFKTEDSGEVKEFNLIDGGVAADNPALVAIGEMFKWDPSILRTIAIEGDQLLVLSLGTGARKLVKKYSASKASKWGVLGWLLGDQSNPLIDVFAQMSDDMVDIYLAVLFQTLKNEENYLRIQDDTLKKDVCVLDIATGECTKKLLKVGEQLLKKDVSRVNLETGICEPVNKGQNSKKTTNEDALIRMTSNPSASHSTKDTQTTNSASKKSYADTIELYGTISGRNASKWSSRCGALIRSLVTI